MTEIPESGAIFTLGKSYLAENEQSYFFIKNDPVARLISGSNQSAVICESGRLFVWGENHYGQLGIGGGCAASEIVTKPTCVKTLKSLGHKICDIAFGSGWSVIVTHLNGIFFCGRNIFPKDTKVFSNFTETKLSIPIQRKPFQLIDFDELINDGGGDEKFIRICAGDNHFVVMTSNGRLFTWGNNESHQLATTDHSPLTKPIELKINNNKITSFTCGTLSTFILTENNQIFQVGQLKNYKFEHFKNLSAQIDNNLIIISIYASPTNEIFLVTDNGTIFCSDISLNNNNDELKFQQFYDYDYDNYGPVKKLLKGTSFYVALTTNNRVYTTFSENGHHLQTFREIIKFKNLNILDVATGKEHILVFGVPINNVEEKLNINSLVKNHNELNDNLTRIDSSSKFKANEVEKEIQETVKPNTPLEYIDENMNVMHTVNEDDYKVSDNSEECKNLRKNSLIDIIEEVSNPVTPNSEEIGDLLGDEKNDKIDKYKNENEIQTSTMSTNLDAPSSSLDENFAAVEELNDTYDADDRRVSDESKSPESIRSNGTIKLAPLKKIKSTPSIALTQLETPKGSIRSIKFDEKSLKSQKSSERLIRPLTPYSGTKQPRNIKVDIEANVEEDLLETTSPDFADSLENTPASTTKINDVKLPVPEKIEQITLKKSSGNTSYVIKQRYTEKHLQNGGNEDDEELEVEVNPPIDALVNKTIAEDIRFINDGIDVTDNVSRKIAVDAIDPIDGKKDYKINIIEETNSNTPDNSVDESKLKTISNTEDDEQTTASINSNKTGNPFENDLDENNTEKDPTEDNKNQDVETGGKGRKNVKRFINCIKNTGKEISCRTCKSVRVEDEPPKYTVIDEYLEQQKTSKVCTIL